MIIVGLAVLVAISLTAFLSFGSFARTVAWRATITPLASIIGSGFLICGPLLAREFGGAAFLAMAALLLMAQAIGAVIRFNIIHAENYLATASFHAPIVWLARVTQTVLAGAYAVSVAYYLKLLAEFCLKTSHIPAHWHVLVSNCIVTTIILVLSALAFTGGLRRVETLAHSAVSLKIGVIGGLLAGLAIWWALHDGATAPLLAPRITLAGVPMLLGLLITVQGFETSRYMGHAYTQDVRIRTMRRAQWIAAAIYLAFLFLLTPFLGRAAHTEGVAGIVDIMGFIAPTLAALVLIGAVSSQLSAAVADSIGSSGLINEVTRRRVPVSWAFATSSALALVIVWLTDPFQIVADSSRAFALFYALQCVLALAVSFRTGVSSWTRRVGFAAIGMICLAAALLGAPAG